MRDKLNYVCFTPNLDYLPYTEHTVDALLSKIKSPETTQLVFLLHQEVTKIHLRNLYRIIGSYGAPQPIVFYPELDLEMGFRKEDVKNVLSTKSQTPFYRLFLPFLL